MIENNTSWIHRQAGLAAQFEAQDKGETFAIDSTTIVGKLPDSETWIVRIDGQETDAVANGEYWWPSDRWLAVYKQENGEPISRDATDEEIALFEGEDKE